MRRSLVTDKRNFDDVDIFSNVRGQLRTGGLTRAAGSSQCPCEDGKMWWRRRGGKWPGDGDAGGGGDWGGSLCCCRRFKRRESLAACLNLICRPVGGGCTI